MKSDKEQSTYQGASDKEEEIQRLGREIFRLIGEETPGIFRKDWWSGKTLEWCMRNPEFKVQMFRLVDVLPSLKSIRQVSRHIQEYFPSSGVQIPQPLRWSLGALSSNPITAALAALRIRKNVRDMASRFILPPDLDKALGHLRRIWNQGMSFTIDILGEEAVSEKEALQYQRRYLELLDRIGLEIARWPPQDPKREQCFPRLNISVKLSSLYSRLDPVDFSGSLGIIKERLRPIFRKAMEYNGLVNIDMEHYQIKDLTIAIFKSLLEEEEFRKEPAAGIVIQMYLKDSIRDLHALIGWAQERNRPITIRLVKGAYWDYEQATARLAGWPPPVYPDKAETDSSFETATCRCLEHYPLIKTAIATHNVRSLAHGIIAARRLGLSSSDYEIQMLLGMAEPVKRAILELGCALREYVPIGELLPGMAYLVRRLLENTSNESFLRQSFTDRIAPDILLRIPRASRQTYEEPPAEQPHAYRPEPHLDFSKEASRDAFRKALEQVESTLGETHPLMVGGKQTRTERKLLSVNPARPHQLIGESFLASRVEAEQAVEAAKKASSLWEATDAEQRAACLLKAAELMRSRRFELAALQVFEVSKTWREADADVCEAIDFCEYYGRQMLELGKPRRMDPIEGEVNLYFYVPRGIALVVAPWNFPLAISTGMVAAALVTGNAVIYKPSSLSPIVGAELARIMWEAGIPAEALQFLPFSGEELGPLLVGHPEISTIAFTGSKESGLEILKMASHVTAGQSGIKKVIAEMGGKNAIIVDENADLDAAVQGVVESAFGFQGQKCSACSRVIVLEEAYARFAERVVEAAKSIRVGDPVEPGIHMGAIIDSKARRKILDYIEIGKSEGRLIFQGEAPSEGYFVGPTIFEGILPDHRLAQEEIFGPVLVLIKATGIDQAIDIANSTEYALTGGIYSRSPGNIERVKKAFMVGNLYINRKITGAVVGRQPFGGFKMSGIGSKTGGPDYLIQFMQARTVTENTIRRGFVPEMDTRKD